MAKNKHHLPSYGGLVNETRNKLMLEDGELTGTQQATKKALSKMETFDEVFGTVLSDTPKTKFALFDIETGIADDAIDYQPDFDLLKPEIKEPRYKKDGELYANSKSVLEQEADWLTKREQMVDEWVNQCPLNAMTAKIICISYQRPNGDMQLSTIDSEKNWNEQGLINLAWNFYKEARDQGWTLVGHNIKKFDLPMLVRRSWKHGIKPLYDGMTPPWESKWIVDTMILWNQGNYGEKFISLDNLGQFLGLGKKTGKGKEFAKMLETDYKAAIEYVTSEMKLLNNIANKLL